jgi:hypothetical protein
MEHGSMKRSRHGLSRARIDHHRIIENLVTAVPHSHRQEDESGAWGISPIETYLKDKLKFAGVASDE